MSLRRRIKDPAQYKSVLNPRRDDMYPIIFSIGSVNIYTHGVMIALGSLIGGYVFFLLAKKENLQSKYIFDICLYSLIIGLIGARLIFVIFNFYQFNSWQNILYLSLGGFISFGGIIFGYLTAALYLRAKKENILRFFELGTVGFFLGWAIGKVGCFLNGDTPGLRTQSKMAIGGQFPVALFEAFWALLIFLALYLLITYQKNLIRKFKTGSIFLFGFALYFLGRFFIDFARDEKIFFWNLRLEQFASLLFFIITLIFLILINRAYISRKNKVYPNINGENNVKKNI